MSLEHKFTYGLLRCNAYIFYFILKLDEDFGGFKQDLALVGRCQDGYREKLRLQGDQEAHRVREHILSLVNRKIAWDGGCGKGSN